MSKRRFMILALASRDGHRDLISDQLELHSVRPARWWETLWLRLKARSRSKTSLRRKLDTGVSVGVHISDEQYKALVGTTPCSAENAASRHLGHATAHSLDLIVTTERDSGIPETVQV